MSATSRRHARSESRYADDIHKWIDELSHDAFTVRQAAAARLLAAGTPARDALLAVADGPDPETRAAARRLVALIDRTEFNRRLEAFAADTDGKRGLTLPGWEQFRKLVGGDPPARALFVDMQRAEGALLAAAFGVSSQPPEQLWEERLMRLVSWQVIAGNRSVAPPLGSCAAMMFLGSVSEIDVSDSGAVLVENLIQRPPDQRSAGRQAAARRRAATRRRLDPHCPNKNEDILQRGCSSCRRQSERGSAAGAGRAPAATRNMQTMQPATRARRVLLVGQFGGPEHVEQLEPLLEDTRSACRCRPRSRPAGAQRAGSRRRRSW